MWGKRIHLDPPVGKGDPVSPLRGVPVPLLLCVKVEVCVLVLDGVPVLVLRRVVGVGGGVAVGGGGRGVAHDGGGEERDQQEGLGGKIDLWGKICFLHGLHG